MRSRCAKRTTLLTAVLVPRHEERAASNGTADARYKPHQGHEISETMKK